MESLQKEVCTLASADTAGTTKSGCTDEGMLFFAGLTGITQSSLLHCWEVIILVYISQ